MKRVMSATNDEGTIFWKITKNDLKKSRYYENLWFAYMIDNYPLNEVIDVDSLFGSIVDDNVIYLCRTDGEPIFVGTNEEDPEEVLEIYPLKSLGDYIQDNPPENIINYITESELYFGVHSVDEVARDLLASNDFLHICESAYDLGILDL